jgi:Rrf2 family protein
VKLSSKGRYAVRALFDIAFYNEGRPTQVKDIADRQNIPPRFLEQIFQELKRAGIVGSKRGPQGGYLLAQGADAIRLGDVVRALEGPISLMSENPPEAGLVVDDAAFDETADAAMEALGARVAAPRRGRANAPANGTRSLESRPSPPPEGQLATESIFRDLSERIEACFDAVTIEDICARAAELGIRRPGHQGYVYVI